MGRPFRPRISLGMKRSPIQRRTPLRPVSLKKQAEIGSGKPKPASAKKTKKKVGKQTLVNKADKLAGAICRAAGECEACDYVMRSTKGEAIPCSGGLQWCHVMSRRYFATRWDPRNCVCMCASHHRYFTARPLEFGAFIESRNPGTTQYLRDKLAEPFKSTVDYLATECEKLKAIFDGLS